MVRVLGHGFVLLPRRRRGNQLGPSGFSVSCRLRSFSEELQEEANFHNIFIEQMGPAWMLVFRHGGWGLFLPVMRPRGGAGKLLERLRVIEPPISAPRRGSFSISSSCGTYPLEMTPSTTS
jgi:hypothetical protein